MDALGSIEIVIEEIRGLSKSVEYVAVDYVNQLRKLHYPSKEAITYKVYSLQSEVELYPLHKKLIGDKRLGQVKLAIPAFQEQPEKHEWFPMYNYVSAKKLQKNIKQEREVVGEIRLHVKYTNYKEKKEVKAKGLVFNGEWIANSPTSAPGGTLNHGTWAQNPQYLLHLKEDDVDFNIKLTHPTDQDIKISFYVIQYDAKLDGRKKVSYEVDEIVKIDSFWSPIFSDEPKSNLSLEKGKYVVIPCVETPGTTGKYMLNIWASKERDQELIEAVPLPESEGKQWIHQKLDGEWTKETSGGGDIANSLDWKANPQFLLEVKDQDLKGNVVLGQAEKEYCIGFYVLEHSPYNRKELTFAKELHNSNGFKYQSTVGVGPISLKKDKKYVIIPATNKSKVVAPFTLNVYADHPFQLSPLTQTWEHMASAQGQWSSENGTAGGSPNNDTFVDNPQFSFRLDKACTCMIELAVSNSSDAIGFVVFRKDKDDKKKVTEDDISEDNVLFKTDNWIKRLNNIQATKISEEEASDSVFVVIPSLFAPNVDKSFELKVYSDAPILDFKSL